MKAKELSEKLLQYPEFEVQFHFLEKDNSEWGITLRDFKNVDISDIGHSDKKIFLGGDEE